MGTDIGQVKRRTALITGASAGIGEAFALVLAENGFDVVLCARRQDRLEALAERIESEHGVTAHVWPCDLSDPRTPRRLFEQLGERRIEVDVLINNAGFGSSQSFIESAWQAQADFLQVMLVSVAELCHLFGAGMRARGYGRIVNVSSVAAFAPELSGTLYASVKRFLVGLTQTLARGYEGTGVQVSALCPGFTYTEFHDVLGNREKLKRVPRFMWMDARTVARQGYDAVMAGKTICVNGWVNRLLVLICRMVPARLMAFAWNRLTARKKA